MKSCNLKGKQKVFFLQTNQVASCCRAYPTSLGTNSISELEQQWDFERLELDRGIEIPNCKACWDDESQGYESLRQRAKFFKETSSLELFVDNACNQMCSYCSPKFSSTWQQSVEQHGMFQHVSIAIRENIKPLTVNYNPEAWLSQIQNYIDQCDDHSVNLVLLGGEPLMQIRNLQNLLDVNLTKISKLQIITNLNPPNPKFLHWVLDAFPKEKLHIAISLDATPEYNHVPRGKFNSAQFSQNFELLKNRKIKFKFLSVVSALGLFDLDNFVKWANGTQIDFTKINNPDCLHPKYLPNFIKNQILSNLEGLAVPNFILELLKQTEEPVGLKLLEQYNYLTEYFRRVDITPALVDNALFQQYWNWLETFVRNNYENRSRK